GTTHGAAVISLPRSQVEMTEWDQQQHDKIIKVVHRVAKDLIANDESEISEVVRRRLFEDIGTDKIRKAIAKAYADWCFERRAQLPPEWTTVDSSMTEAKAKEVLRSRFETCYPFHPATLSVFQRKWQALPQYQQTRGTLAMLAQWISWAYRAGFEKARKEPLITLGSAPLEIPEFRSVVLGQLGEPRLTVAIDTDIAGLHSHSRVLDADTKGFLKDIYRRVGTVIFFESSGGQTERVAHLPEMRFALGEPGFDTTSIDNAAMALENSSYFIRKVGTDGFRISYKPTMKKVVNDRRASLDDDTDIKPLMSELVRKEFEHGATLPMIYFPKDSSAVPDTPKLTAAIMDADVEWDEKRVRKQIADWTKQRGKSPRLYPGALVWCIKKQGKDLREKVAMCLAWKKVEREISEGTLGSEFDQDDLHEVRAKRNGAEEAAKDEVWAGFRHIVRIDSQEQDGLKMIDLGAGHSSSGMTLCGRVITALKSQSLLNETVGAGYIERKWPPALKDSGAWPLTSLRQSFLNGSLTRLLDPDNILRNRIQESVKTGDFGLASGEEKDGFNRVWFEELVPFEEIVFEPGVYLLTKARAKALKCIDKPDEPDAVLEPEQPHPAEPTERPTAQVPVDEEPKLERREFKIHGSIPPELWNRVGTRIIPKLRTATESTTFLEFSATLEGKNQIEAFERDIKQMIEDLNLAGKLKIE
ncbi:MAG: DUF499 domain-containing protein, partial [Candidatus Wallbacteria bacterium]|nr:DUF499 domain-containing protein [Candidatus Wallbacteria bacterium]